MPDQTDRYPVSPLDGPAMFKDDLKEINRRLSALEGAPLVGSNFTALDLAGAIRVVAGHLPDDTYGMEIDGGKVRALELDVKTIRVPGPITLTVAPQRVATLSFVPPVWAVKALVAAWSSVQVTDTSGGASLFVGATWINGTKGNNASQGLAAAGMTGNTASFHALEVAPVPNPIDVHTEASIQPTGNTSNNFTLVAIAIYTR